MFKVLPGKIGEACPAGYTQGKVAQRSWKDQVMWLHLPSWCGASSNIWDCYWPWGISSLLGLLPPRLSPEDKRVWKSNEKFESSYTPETWWLKVIHRKSRRVWFTDTFIRTRFFLYNFFIVRFALLLFIVWDYLTRVLADWANAYGGISVTSGPAFDYNYDGLPDSQDVLQRYGASAQRRTFKNES